MILSIIIPYYRNPRMLGRQLTVWRDEWPDRIKRRCEIVIVDDGSPEPAAKEVQSIINLGLPVSVYRVLVDKPWNQHGARNLGAYMAQASWLLLTDMDHVIPADTVDGLLSRIREDIGDRIYTFSRKDAPVEPWRADDWRTMRDTLDERGELKPHVNSFAMPRDLYWRVGGYDEEFCGTYGTDRFFRDRLFAAAPRVHLTGWPLIRVPVEVIPDAATTTLSRKRRHMKKQGHEVKVIQFEWERVI